MLVIGDEILDGFVTDTNSGWVARRLHQHGVPLERVHTVPDEVAAIDEALTAELARPGPRVVLTSGGIGSTPDDRTFEAVAESLGRDLVEHPELVERIRQALEWTRSKGVEVTDEFAWHMMRMARIPDGGELLSGSSGFAPGIRVDLDGGAGEDRDGASVVILPGVPSHLKGIMRNGIEPDLLADRNEPRTVVEITHTFPESALNLCFVEVMDEHPEVKVGSYPGMPMLVRVTGPEEEARAAGAKVRDYVRDLEEDPAGARLADAWAARFGGAERERR